MWALMFFLQYIIVSESVFDSHVQAFVVFRPYKTARRRLDLIPRASATFNETSISTQVALNDTLLDMPMTETHQTVPTTLEEDAIELPAKTLDGRLLCASQCAYNTSSPYYEGAGYISGSTTVQLSIGVNSVFIGETIDGIVLAFRGTKTKSPLDWLQNAALFLQRVPGVMPGRVHTGFYRAVKSVWDPMKSTVLDMLAERDSDTKIFLCGHSKGGAMASIAGIMMNRDSDLPNVPQIVTFASAKPGDSTFAKVFNRQVNQTSYEYYLDIVPFLPPSQAVMDAMDEEGSAFMEEVLWDETTMPEQPKEYRWDYQPVGTRRYIDGNITIVNNVTREVDDQRVKDIEQKTLLSLREFAAAHCLTCPRMDGKCKGGYFAAVAGEVCQCCKDW